MKLIKLAQLKNRPAIKTIHNYDIIPANYEKYFFLNNKLKLKLNNNQ